MISKSFEASKESEVKESIESAMPEQEHLKEEEDENENVRKKFFSFCEYF